MGRKIIKLEDYVDARDIETLVSVFTSEEIHLCGEIKVKGHTRKTRTITKCKVDMFQAGRMTDVEDDVSCVACLALMARDRTRTIEEFRYVGKSHGRLMRDVISLTNKCPYTQFNEKEEMTIYLTRYKEEVNDIKS